MNHLINIILAKTPEEAEAAEAELHKHNAEAPSDREVLTGFLKNCTTLDGRVLTLDEQGRVTACDD